MRINYTTKGQGKTVVLLHGWGGSSESLEKLAEELAGNYQVVNIDLPGFGKSDVPQTPLKVEDYVEYLKEFLEQMKLRKVTLVGHSFGGKVIMLFATKYPKFLESIILINASGLKPKNSLKKTLFIVPTKVLGSIFKLPLLKQLAPTLRNIYYKLVVRERDYLNAGPMKETLKVVVNQHFDQQVIKITTPTLLIWGEKDTQTPLWMAKALAKKIQGARLEIVKGATHGLPLKQPGIVANLIKLFLN